MGIYYFFIIIIFGTHFLKKKKHTHTTIIIEALSMFKYTKHELLPRYKKVSKI